MEKMERGFLTSLFEKGEDEGFLEEKFLKEEHKERRKKLINLWRYFFEENQKGRFLFLYKDIMRETGMKKRTLSRYLSLLEEKSLILRKRKGKEGVYVRVKTDVKDFKIKNKETEKESRNRSENKKSEVREIAKDVMRDFTEEMRNVFSTLVEVVKSIKEELVEEGKENKEKKEGKEKREKGREGKGEDRGKEESKGKKENGEEVRGEEKEKKGKVLTLKRWEEKKTERGIIRIFYPEWFIWVRGEERRANVYQWLRGVLISVLFVKTGEWIGVFLVPEEGGEGSSSFSVKLSYFKREVFSAGGLGEKEIKERLVSLLGREVFCFFSSDTGFYFGGEIGEKGLSIFKSFIKDCAEVRVVLQKKILERGVSPKIYSLKGIKIVIE